MFNSKLPALGLIWLMLSLGRCSADQWLPEFMISYWGCPQNDAVARVAEQAGFNTVICPREKLDLCRKHGLKAIVTGVTAPEAAELSEDPAVWGYFVMDEPGEPPTVAETVAKFHQADVHRPAYVNLMAWEDLDRYLSTVQPRVLSYDYYQWWWNRAVYFDRLEVHRAAALQAGIPLIVWVEANSDPRWEWGEKGQTWLPDNLSKLRHSVYCALAYGAKGIQWFNEYLIFQCDSQRRPLPRLRRAGRDVATINAELNLLGPVLINLRSTDVFHTTPLPQGTQQVPPACHLQPVGCNWLLGLFADSRHREYAMLVNRDYTSPRWAVVALAGDLHRVDKLNCTTGEWDSLPVTQIQGRRAVEFIVAAGKGELLRYWQ